MQLLAWTQFERRGICVEIRLEVGYGVSVWMLVVNAQSTTYIDVLHRFKTLFLQSVLQFIDTKCKRMEIVHDQYLAADVEVQTDELNVAHLLGHQDDALHILHCDAEFVLCQAGGNVGMSVSSHVGIDSEAHPGSLVKTCGNLLYHLQFGYTLHIEVLDTGIQSKFYLPVCLPDTCIHDA